MDNKYEVVGKVKFFDTNKGFGFVIPDEPGPDILLHAKILRESGFKKIQEGAKIKIIASLERGRWRATEVLSLEELEPEVGPNRVIPTSGLERVVVRWFNKEKGFGFVTRGRDTEDIFLHAETLRDSGIIEIFPGQSLLVRYGETPNGLATAEIYPDRG